MRSNNTAATAELHTHWGREQGELPTPTATNRLTRGRQPNLRGNNRDGRQKSRGTATAGRLGQLYRGLNAGPTEPKAGDPSSYYPPVKLLKQPLWYGGKAIGVRVVGSSTMEFNPKALCNRSPQFRHKLGAPVGGQVQWHTKTRHPGGDKRPIDVS
ncbi:hypothetical protein GOODEAATRI_000699 [Goodea atripinnis]|uniref:Ribosomal protein L2 n=1 Tax=Goodea atripinnis TaxID=208336 RepID=A0ABV0NQT5_9TELE